MHKDKTKYLALLLLPGIITLLTTTIEFPWLPVIVQQHLTPFSLAVAMVWAFHFPEMDYKRAYRWWVLGPMLAFIVVFNIKLGSLNESYTLLINLAGFISVTIALIAYAFRAGKSPKDSDSDIRALQRSRRVSTFIGLLCLVFQQVANWFDRPYLLTTDNMVPVLFLIIAASALAVSVITYYAEGIKRAFMDDQGLEEKIEQIGEAAN